MVLPLDSVAKPSQPGANRDGVETLGIAAKAANQTEKTN
jgi:hypothetical protein